MNLHIRVLHNGLTTKMFSAECGSPLNSSRVATANLVLYPTIIPGSTALAMCCWRKYLLINNHEEVCKKCANISQSETAD